MTEKRGRKPVEKVDETPQPPLGKPRMPNGLDTLAKAEWKRVLPLLDEMGITSKVDGTLLAIYVIHYSRWMAAQQELQTKDGYVVDTPNGYEQPSPWLGIANNAVKIMRDAMNDLGMSPQARQKMKALPRPQPEAAKWDKFNLAG